MISLFSSARRIMTVSELIRAIRYALDSTFEAPVSVRGEVSGYSVASSGHVFFGLKDAYGFVACVCYRDTAAALASFLPLQEGAAVEVRGRVSVYAPRSQYQLTVDDVAPVGQGELYRRFEALKQKLKVEGLFDDERKRNVPAFISRVAIVTSRDAAALQDFVTTCRARGAHVQITLVHAPVQGEAAAPELVRAIARAGALDVDVVVVARGGGSIEDLWAFNTEAVARAIAACAKPVISAVGHETDYTIADFVADVRAATPTAAAARVAGDRMELLKQLDRARTRLANALVRLGKESKDRLVRARDDLAGAGKRLVNERLRRVDDAVAQLGKHHPRRTVEEFARRLRSTRSELRRAVAAALTEARGGLDVLDARMRALGPEGTLARGYAIVFDGGGKVVTDSAAVKVGGLIDVRLKRGGLGAVVREKRK